MKHSSIAFIKLTVALILLNNHMFMNGEKIFRLQCDRIDDKRIPKNEQVLLWGMKYIQHKDNIKYIHVNSDHKVIDVSAKEIREWNAIRFDSKQVSTFSVFTMAEIDTRYYLSNVKEYSTQKDFQILCRGKDGIPTETKIMESSKDPMPHHCLWSGRDNGGLSFIPLRAFALRQSSDSEGLKKVYEVPVTIPLESSSQKFILVKTESGSWIISFVDYTSALINNLWQLNFLWIKFHHNGRYDTRRGMWHSYMLEPGCTRDCPYIITNANDWEYWETSYQKDENYNVAANTMMLCNQRSMDEYYIEVKPNTENENLRPQNVNDCCVWIRNSQTGLFFISVKYKE